MPTESLAAKGPRAQPASRVSPEIHMLTATPQGDGVRRWAVGRGLRDAVVALPGTAA